MPVVIPSRITDGFVDMLRETRLQTVVVLHVNHARELDAGVRDAARRLRDAGATLLNQAVLLRGVNDNPGGVGAIVPVPLFSGDTALLPAHARPGRGRRPLRRARCPSRAIDAANCSASLPGYLVPRLVREVPGAASKTPLAI